jgi:hypothetical protein
LEQEMLLAPFDSSLRDYNLDRKRPRYYQRLSVNRHSWPLPVANVAFC